MNKVVVGAAVLAVVAGGGVAVAGWSGAKVADGLHAESAKMLQAFPAVKVVEHKVSKGLLSSTHELTVEAGCAPEAGADAAAGAATSGPVQFTWRDHISHVPVPGGRGVGLAAIDSELVLPPKAAAQVAKLLGDKPLFTARTNIGFGGDYVTTVSSPAFKFAEEGKGNLDWQGVQLVVRGNVRQGLAAGGSYSMDAPGLLLNVTGGASPMTVKVGQISMKGDITPQPDASLWMAPGKGTGSIASIEFSSPRPGADAAAKPLSVVFEGLQLSSDSKLENGLLSATSQFGFKGRVDDFPIDKVEMQVALRRIHAATYQQMVSRMMSTAFSCDKAAKAGLDEAANAEMEKGLAALLQHNPEYALDKLAIELAGQRAEIAYTLGTRGVTEADRESPLPVLFGTKGFGTASLKVQMGWIEQITKKIAAVQAGVQPGAAADTEAAAALQAAQGQLLGMANMMIEQGVAQGFLQREGDLVKSSLKFEAGQLTVNDKPMGLPPMGAH